MSGSLTASSRWCRCRGSRRVGVSSPFHPANRAAAQADHCGEFPFFYVILGSDKIIVIDTGVGPPSGEIGAAAAAAAPQAKRSLRAILDEQLNPAGLPYKILATHVHYDHIGNVAGFADEAGHVDVAMGDGDKEYASRIADFACGAARGARVAPFTVTQWLAPGEEVFLDDSRPCAWNAVRALPTPGHTPDGTAYFFPREGRLFVADTVYPFTAISLLCRGSSLPGYAGSITNLLQVVDEAEEGGRPPPPEDEGGSAPITAPPPDMPVPAPPSPPSSPPAEEEDKGGDSVADAAAAALEELTPAQRKAVTELVSVWLGLEGGLAGVWQTHRWDPLALLTVCDWNVEGAVGMWGDMGHAGLRGMMPAPHASTSAIAAAVGGAGSTPDNVVPVALALPVAGGGGDTAPPYAVTLACGHVEAALPARPALKDIFDTLLGIAAGTVKPSKVLAIAPEAPPAGDTADGTASDEPYPEPVGAAEYHSLGGSFVLHLPFPPEF